MAALPLAAVGGGLLAIGGTVLAYCYDGADDRAAAVEASLADDQPAPTDAPLRGAPEVTGVHEVAEHDDGGPVVVPVVRVPLATDDPGRDGVSRHVAAAVEALHDAFGDAHVRGYDVEFGFDDGSVGGMGRTVRRVAVPPELADRMADPDYGYRDLRSDVADGDDGDPGTPPVDWGEPIRYQSEEAAGATAAATAGGAV